MLFFEDHLLVEHIIREELQTDQITLNPESIEMPPLSGFSFDVTPQTPRDFFTYKHQSSSFHHNTDKVAHRIEFRTSTEKLNITLEFDSTVPPEISVNSQVSIQYISRGFGAPKTHNYKENCRFLRKTMEREYLIADIALMDYLRLQGHLPAVQKFLSAYENTKTSLTHDTIIKDGAILDHMDNNDPKLPPHPVSVLANL